MLDLRPARALGPGNGNHIEAGVVIEQAVAFEIDRGQTGETPLFVPVDSLGRMAMFIGLACLDLDKHHRAPVDGHQIEFAKLRPDTTADDMIAQPAEKAGGRRLATLPQRARPEGGEKPVE